MSNDRIARVQYFPQQFLRTEDFNAEQAYHLEMRRRHHTGHHIWGVVYGLQIITEEEGLFVQPGMAVDGFGRELILPERLPVPLSEFDAKDSDRLDVWLLYNRRGSDQAPAGYGRCNPETRTAFYRWQELPALRLERPDPNYPDPRRPKAVVEAGVESVPQQRPPDDPAKQWPVFLGRLLRDRSDPEQPVYSVDQLGRPVAGLVGDAVVSPSRRAVVFVGDTRRVDESGQVPVVQQTGRFSVALRHEQEELTEHLRIRGPGELDFYGRTRLHGDLALADGAIRFESTGAVADLPLCSDIGRQGDAGLQRFESATAQSSPCDPSAARDGSREDPRPWRIYRHRCRTSDTGDEAEVRDQLRIEMGTRAARAASEVVIGAWSPDEEAFKPILTVGNTGANGGQVTVHGNLVVKGDITKDVAASAARLSPQARNFFLGTFSSGVGGANLQLEKFYRSPFGGEFDVCDDEVQTGIVNDLLADADCLNRFVEKLVANSTARGVVAERMVALSSGREAILDAMPPDADVNAPLNQFAALLEQATYADRLPAFAGALARTEDGQRATIEAMPAGSPELTAFAALARDQYPAWLSAFLGEVQDTPAGAEAVAEALLSGSDGRTAVGANLATNTGRIGTTLTPVLADTVARAELADTLLENADGRTSAGDNLAANTTRISSTLAPVLADTAARTELTDTLLANTDGRTSAGDNLAANTTRISSTLAPVLADTAARAELADTLLANADGRTSAGDNLAANTTRISSTLAPVLADTAARAELTDTLLANADGRTTAGDNLVANTARIAGTLAPVMAAGAARAELADTLLATTDGQTTAGANLAANSGRIGPTVTPVLADTAARTELVDNVMQITDGRTSVGDNLVLNTTRLNDTLVPVIGDTAARDTLTEQLLADAGGRTSTGQNLLSNPTRWGETIVPVLTDADATSRNTLAGLVMDDNNGRVAVADYLEGNDPPRPAFVTLINDSAYATLKGDICATCP